MDKRRVTSFGFPQTQVQKAKAQAPIMAKGAMVGLLSGGPPLRRAVRQLLIGYGAAAITYVLGLLFGVSMG